MNTFHYAELVVLEKALQGKSLRARERALATELAGKVKQRRQQIILATAFG